MSDSRTDGGVASLLRELSRVQEHHRERAGDPDLAQALAYLGTWQSRRLRRTYADLERTPRYAMAMTFFETDLYGGADFAQRDADLMRIVPAMRRVVPDTVIGTIAVAVELNALSQDLDRAMVDELRTSGAAFSVADYCAAYRRLGRLEERRDQIRLIGDVGTALDRFVNRPMVNVALTMMRTPARLAGLSALQDFLERGFAAFARMQGAKDFLTTIQQRETAILEAILGGSDAPFPDPMT